MWNKIIVFLTKASSRSAIRKKVWKYLGQLLLLFKENTVKRFVKVLYSPSHRHAGAPMMNIQSTFRTAPDSCKKVSLALSYYLVAMVIHMQSLRCQICVYNTHILHNIETLVGQKKYKSNKASVNSACQGNLTARHFGHARHRFLSPGLGSVGSSVLSSVGSWRKRCCVTQNSNQSASSLLGPSWLQAPPSHVTLLIRFKTTNGNIWSFALQTSKL
jgi:hypothetical protein